MSQKAPVITIDGPSGVGKGTLSQIIANQLGWHWLDSGALYRIVAWVVEFYQLPINQPAVIAAKLSTLSIQFQPNQQGLGEKIWVDGHEVTQAIRSESCARQASQLSALPAIRAALLERQRHYQQAPGLVTDGRDMGTVVFPDAELKIFLIASPEVRAERRYKQLQAKGLDVTLREIFDELVARDARDANRPISPTKPADDAILVDTSLLTIDEVVEKIIGLVNRRFGLVDQDRH